MHAVGGVEKELPSKVRKVESADEAANSAPDNMQMGQIIRDDAGNVLEVKLPDSNEGSAKGKAKDESTPWGKPLDVSTLETPSVPLTFDDNLKSGKSAADTDAVKCESVKGIIRLILTIPNVVLEAKAANARPVGRNTSNDEMKWLIDIVKKHGRDLEEASRDLKLNRWQKTKGELTRA